MLPLNYVSVIVKSEFKLIVITPFLFTIQYWTLENLKLNASYHRAPKLY